MRENKDVQVMLKEAGILFAITLIAGLILGFVHELTKEPIRVQQELAVQKACAAVFADAESFEKLEYAVPEGEGSLSEELSADGVEIGALFAALDGTKSRLGYVVEVTTHEGYGGDIVLYAGITEEGLLKGVSLLEISETPGLGMRAEEVLIPQLRNKQVKSFTYTKTGSQSDSEVDAISGATVTTKAVTNAVNGALKLITTELLEGGAVNE